MFRDEWSINRKSIAYFPSQEFRSRNDPKLMGYNYMFGEDVRHRIMPFGIDHSKKYIITLSRNTQENETLVTSIFSNESYPRVSHTIAEAIREYASRIIWWRKTFYEIAPVDVKPIKHHKSYKKVKTPMSDFVKPLHIPGKVFILGNKVIQVVPRPDRKEFKRSFTSISKKHVWILSVPPELGGVRSLRKIQGALALSNDYLPKSLQEKNWLEDKSFNWKEYNLQRKLLALKGTATWGWGGRSLWDKDILEYYQIIRDLRFTWSMAVLREYILREMNQLLTDHNYNFQIILKGFASRSNVEETIEQFKAGKLPFKDAVSFARLWNDS